MNDQLPYQIALTKIPMVGVKTAKILLSYCGSLEAIFKENKRRLLRIPGIGEKIVEAIAVTHPFQVSEPDISFMERNGIKSLFFLDKHFPERLKAIDDAPLLLFFRGTPSWNHPRTLSIVGTRKPSEYGKGICRRVIEDLAHCNVQLISGLAHGIDGVMHRTCIKLGLENIAVMGTGMDVVYPAAHRNLAAKVVEHGAVITEYAIRTRADKDHFPRRNRIIAGMSDACLVIESPIQGGSMITARYANSYHKDVMAIPGKAGDELAAGCNHLIKTNQAHLVERAEDIVQLMQWKMDGGKKHTQKTLFLELTAVEKDIIDILKSCERMHIDHLQSRLTLTPSVLAAGLLNLELHGIVHSLPGRFFAFTG